MVIKYCCGVICNLLMLFIQVTNYIATVLAHLCMHQLLAHNATHVRQTNWMF